MQKINIFWFRRDLRLEDNAGLYQALKNGDPVLPVFIFDKNILSKLQEKKDRRVEFIHATLEKLQEQLVTMNSSLQIFYGTPVEAFQQLLSSYNIGKVYANHDYDPSAIERDTVIKEMLFEKGISFLTFKDQVIFEKAEVVKEDGKPYTVFTPYSKKWKTLLRPEHFEPFPGNRHFNNFIKTGIKEIPSLEIMGFEKSGIPFPTAELDETIVSHYKEQRDIPGISGTSKLGLHLRFGTVSIRDIAKKGAALNDTYLNELIWRDFYHMILWHFPLVGKGRAFKPAYDTIEWRRDNGEFEKWCNGQTGYPIVDAGMRELNATGFMHNRVRMIVASFLTKHLLLDWRLGEAYFAQKLLDFDMAANNGGWQWAAGSGCDAAPYFRIFNPYIQTKKFDPEYSYIKKWVPEFEAINYPPPIVVHEEARRRCLEVYSKALNKEKLMSGMINF